MPKHTSSNLLVLLCLFASLQLIGQTACLQFFETEEIVALGEDASHVWLGTEASGLIKFDKLTQTLAYFDKDNSSLSGNRVRSMVPYLGDMLISTDSSLQLFDSGNFSTFESELTGELIIDLDGKLLVVADTALYYFDGSLQIFEQSFFDFVNNESWSNTTDIAIDASNELWISHFMFYEFDVFHYDGVDWEVFDYNNTDFVIESPIQNGITAVEDNILATNGGGLYEFIGAEWLPVHAHNDPARIVDGTDTLSGVPLAVGTDQSQGYWVGSLTDGWSGVEADIAHFADGNWTILPKSADSIFNVNVIHASQFDSKIVYAGTGKGLQIIDKACLGLATGIEAPQMIENFFSPNPSTGILQANSPLHGEVSVTDIEGKIVLKRSYNGERKIDATALQSGTYFIHWVENGDFFGQQLLLLD